MLFDHWERMVLGDQNIWKRFIVAQQHVIARLQLLDQVLLKQQRLSFGPRRQEHHRRGFTDHPSNPGRMITRPGIVADPRLQVARLAHIQHAAIRIQHAVNPRRRVKRPQIVVNKVVSSLGCDGLLIRHFA